MNRTASAAPDRPDAPQTLASDVSASIHGRRRARVLLVAPQPFFSVRGTPINVLRIVRILCGAGYDVHLATYSFGETISVPGLTYHRAKGVPTVRSVPIGFSGRKILLDAMLALTVWRLQIAHRFDVVHAVEESVFFALPLAVARRMPLVYDVDSVLSDQLQYTGAVRNRRVLAVLRSVERATLRRCATAITVCQALTDAVRALEPTVPIAQIEDCPSPGASRPPNVAAIAALRRDLGLGEGPVAVYVGNLETYQGLDLLLGGWPHVHARLPAARLVIFGGDDASVAARRAALSALAPADRSIVFAGHRSPDQLSELLALGDVLVSPRRSGENTPLKLYDYMASGTPIIATNLRTHTQVLDASTAVLAKPSPEALAVALIAVLSKPQDYQAMGAAARARVETRYSEREFARKLLDAYDVIMSTPAAERPR